ncbi:hypothetical protein M1D53_09890 [Bacillus sp. PK9-021]
MSIQKLSLKRHTLVANKLLIVMSGLNRNTKRDNSYYYEKHSFGLAKNFVDIKWTGSLMKQILAYVAKCNSQGHISIISEQELANTIQCSVRTVQNNNKLLEDYDIIRWDRLWGDYIQVSLNNYLEDFLDLHIKEAADVQNISYNPEMLDEDNNTYTSKGGYTSVSMEVIYQLLAIKNINMLRLALRALYVYESDVNVKKDSEALLSYTEVKHILPKYIGYKAAIKEMASKLNKIFRIDVLEKDDCVKTLLEEKQLRKSIIEKIKDGFILSFNLTGAHDSKKQKEIEKIRGEHAFTQFKNFFKSFGHYSIKKEDIHSIVHEFGLDIIEKSLTSVQRYLQQTYIEESMDAFRPLVHEMESNFFTYIRKIANGYYQAKINAL